MLKIHFITLLLLLVGLQAAACDAPTDELTDDVYVPKYHVNIVENPDDESFDKYSVIGPSLSGHSPEALKYQVLHKLSRIIGFQQQLLQAALQTENEGEYLETGLRIIRLRDNIRFSMQTFQALDADTSPDQEDLRDNLEEFSDELNSFRNTQR